MSYINPLSGYRISDGWEEHLARGSRGGIDFACGMNTPIPAPCDGFLENVANNGNGYGNYIRFHHADGYVDEFLHLKDGGFVSEGNYKQGDIIGYSGSTGNSTGPHVHWHLLTPSGQRVNPLDYVGGGTGGASPSGVNASMAAAQQLLANVGLYSGPIDGVFGPKSWAATQTWLAKYGLYDGPIDGIPGPKTYAGFQQYGKKNGNYDGALDGILGPRSWAGFVQSMKEDTAAPAPAPAPKPTPAPTPTPAPEKPKPTPEPAKPSKPTRPSIPAKPTKPVKEPTVPEIKPLPADADTAANDALGILIPQAKNRKIAYALYGLAALVVSNLSVAVMASGTQAPVWLIVTSAVVGNLAVPFTTLAIANAGTKK